MDGRNPFARLICGLYLISPPPKNNAAAADNVLQKQCAAALSGGAKILQYRDKNADAQTQLRRARMLKQLCQKHGALFIVNDSPKLAMDSEADGVHLGKTDGEIAAARKLCGNKIIIGASCGGSAPRAQNAANAGADYAAAGAIFASTTKPEAKLCGLAKIAEIKNAANIPVVAIGGITPQNAAQVFAAQADAVAMCAGIFNAQNITAAVKEVAAAAKNCGNGTI